MIGLSRNPHATAGLMLLFGLPILAGSLAHADDLPIADFSYTTDGTTAYFSDASTPCGDEITGWLWDFGDGFVSTQQNPVHAFPLPAEYTVCLQVTDACGTSEFHCELVDVCDDPIPDFSFTVEGLSVAFTDLSDGGSVGIASWLWDFGDGAVSTQQNPIHTFPLPGEYSVCLQVSNPCGTSDFYCRIVDACADPVAEFDFEIDGLTVQFSDASIDGGGGITGWLWDFGDGSVSTEPNPVHTFPVDGDYMTCLIVTDSCAQDTICQVIALDATAIESDPPSILRPGSVRNEPNPFNPATTIRYELLSQTRVALRIFDVAGRLVDILVEGEEMPAGNHAATWPGTDAHGRTMPSGTYFYRLEVDGSVETREMMLIR